MYQIVGLLDKKTKPSKHKEEGKKQFGMLSDIMGAAANALLQINVP